MKARLRRFSLGVPGGYRGRDAGVEFVRDLLACFEWNDDYEGALVSPATVKIVEHGQRSERGIAAIWAERKVLVDVVGRAQLTENGSARRGSTARHAARTACEEEGSRGLPRLRPERTHERRGPDERSSSTSA